jgi:hypothetical protein
MKKKWFLVGVCLVAALLGALVAWAALSNEPRPTGAVEGPEADALARRMLEAVHQDAWKDTGAVRWDFSGRHQLLWDRKRHLARVQWDGKEARLDVWTRQGKAWEDGVELQGDEAQAVVEQAYAWWVNDSFWLHPMERFFDPGVTRALTKDELGRPALLVSWAQGGVTPGDAYLWSVGEDGLPARWKMWVSVLPIGGVEATWEGWTTLASGAKVSTLHKLGPLDVALKVEAAKNLSDLEPDDPFCVLPKVCDPTPPPSEPASKP